MTTSSPVNGPCSSNFSADMYFMSHGLPVEWGAPM